jgi:large conductance mechanosensitive channel
MALVLTTYYSILYNTLMAKSEKKLDKEIKDLEKGSDKSAKQIEKEERLRDKVQTKIGIDKLKKTKAGGVFGGFFEFLQKYSVFGLAIGLVVGDSSKLLVNAIVNGLINPFIGLFLPNSQSLKDWVVTFRNRQFLFGNILVETLNFIIILFLIYFVIKVLLKRDDILEKK